ncbi:MAG: hypothetical protein J6U43_01960 [Bacteroidales bacterium]|nr:hypothetical protein [Bacteroidales bacterium]
MKSLLKYIIPILGLFLCIDFGMERPVADVACTDFHATAEAVVDATDFNMPDAKLCHQRTFHLEILQRVPSNTRRADTESRYNLTYMKAGKVINTGRYYTTYNLYNLRNSALSEPSYLLIRLGKLII